MPLRARITDPTFTGAATFSTATEIPKELPGDDPDDVLFTSHYGVRMIELNRPKKLNSLNGSMVRKIVPRLKEWEKSQIASVIMLSGAGTKAFCAGGDVAALAQLNQQGAEGQQQSTDFFGLEYQLDHLIATYSKPVISVLDGITMGGGVGLSVHAPFRIATERTVFAMPETTIGFFPDVGGSFFLSRLDGELGTYLGLTSERLTGEQALYAGIATHYMDSSALQNLTARLSELVFKDHTPLSERLKLVNNTMTEFSMGLPAGSRIELGRGLRTAIDRCFQYNTVEEIIQALEKETAQKEWAQKTLETLSIRSPTSLKVALRQLRLGKTWSIAEAFQREHHIAAQFMRHPDFVEGVTARLIAKPAREPKWQPATLAEVSQQDVDTFFTIPENQTRLPLLSDTDYNSYPHAHFALPSEKDIEAFIRQNDVRTNTAVFRDFVDKWSQKDGVQQKVIDVLARRTVKTADGLRWVE
ncbi:hypothetical protein ASPZODRAFT_127020 [Penicilliopsis zonata CBS 506.65]|uniref:3-hydroxyisobutyryl-CoA hydrolase n=1 Tax=Penicilliopsis zonata CBS 506.65 TaxID=1073090 RepID=A0A1L9SUX9_9EURO|nr:hypothetical protein ASPZODRAFT_127020 [Penicilliopsis zonata CBS 506.65]OJJ51025.1 hypothetical protein ASPZODRAFT_127020 [Penicilliopsis zonata CBS 506.65]